MLNNRMSKEETIERLESMRANREILDEMLEEAASELSMNEEEFEDVKTVTNSICKRATSKIGKVLGADYNTVADDFIESAREGLSKYVLTKKKQKDVVEEIQAFSRVNTFIQEKKEYILSLGLNEEGELNLLGKLGKFIKTIIVKALNILMATGKIVGKVAIVIATLIAKVSIYTVIETGKAGKAVFTIAMNEYKEAILG